MANDDKIDSSASQSRTLEVLHEAARDQLEAEVKHGEGIDRAAGFLATFSVAAAVLSAPIQSNWLGAGRVLASLAALAALAALLIRGAVRLNIEHVRTHDWEQPAHTVRTTIIDTRLQAYEHVRAFHTWKQALTYLSAVFLVSAVIVVGLGTLGGSP